MGILFSFPVSAYAASSGTLTDPISYELSDDGVLIISGTGDMPDYTTTVFGTKSPFYKSTEIKEVIIMYMSLWTKILEVRMKIIDLIVKAFS